MDETVIINGCIAGDERSFKMLFEKYYGKMLYVCLRFAGDRDEAKDMLQEGFIRAFKNIGQFKFSGSFEGWLRHTIRNTAINFIKANTLRNISDSIDEDEQQLELLEKELNEEHILSDIATDELLAMIQELPPVYRMVFNLFAMEGLSHKEIAGMLDITESTSRSNLTKARMKLQQQLISINKLETSNYVG